jgi:hypothetical protein
MNTRTAHRRADEDRFDDEDLRTALRELAAYPSPVGMPQWETIGRQLLAVARRESLHWPSHAQEFQGAFVDDAIKRLRRYPEKVITADHPWGLLIVRARRAAHAAVAAESRVGITDRDPVTHRVRIAELTKLTVTSYEAMVERSGAPIGRAWA